MKKILGLILVFNLSFLICIFAAGLRFGMSNAVKQKVQELDKKVSEYKYNQNNDQNNNENNQFPNLPLTLKGKFISTNTYPIKNIKPAISIENVSKVIAFSTKGDWYNIENVDNGNFLIGVETGTPIGLVFADANNKYLGYLTLKNGIDSIPLTKISSGVTTIDFQTLTASGTAIEPEYNPLGYELPFSSAEQQGLAQLGGIFASVVRNPDIDGNGEIDILEGKFYYPFIGYWINAGSFNNDTTPSINNTINIQHYNITIQCKETSINATVTGPDGSGITNKQCSVESRNNYVFYSIYPNLGSSPTPIPTAGEYKFTLQLQDGGQKTLTFSVPDQSLASSRIVIAIPTVHLNDDGTINKISWVYKIPNDLSSTLTPTAIINDLILQIEGNNNAGRLYDSPQLPPDITEHTLTQSVSWSAVGAIYMAYHDVYRNMYVVSFSK